MFAALQARRKLVYILLIVGCLVYGLFASFAAYRQQMDMGDSSTFYAFARSMSRGEVPFKDFIHFRTPGTLAVHATFIEIFGEHQSSSRLATFVETICLFPLLFLLAAIIIFRHQKSFLYVFAAVAGAIYASGAAQLRAGFGLLAIACYMASFDGKAREKRWLWATGILTGVTFFFGQEIALIVGICIVAGELLARTRDELLPRAKLLLAGTFVGLLPLLVYIAVFSSLTTFMYYVTYYSFILQPKYMDVPFPGFSYGSLIFYLPFILYGLCFWVLYASRRLGVKEGLLLSFGILRLITALGRADTGHLLFSIPEVFIIVPYFMASIKDSAFTQQVLRRFAPYGLAVVALFVLSMIFSGIWLVFTPFIILHALRTRQLAAGAKSGTYAMLNTYLAVGGTLVLLIYMIFPVYYAFLKYAKQGLATRNDASYRIGGVKFDPITYNEVMQVKATVAPLHPDTVFAFPIQPFYYTLAAHHGSRYMTFEPQTTVKEQETTIKDLQKTRPEVVIFDPLQAHGLSGSLWEISNYLTGHYTIHQQIIDREILWVMVPKDKSARDDKLAFQLYKDNHHKSDAMGVQSSNTGLNNAIAQNGKTIHFYVNSPKGAQLTLSVADSQGIATDPSICGQITIGYGTGHAPATKVCTTNGIVTLPITPSKKPVELVFEKQGSATIIWNDPHITD